MRLVETIVDGRHAVRCEDCGYERVTRWPVERVHHRCAVIGVGSMLAQIIRSLGLRRREDCGCDEMITRMNAWGADGCRERRDEILAHLREAYDATTLAERFAALGSALAEGLPLSIEGLLDEAILRCERT